MSAEPGHRPQLRDRILDATSRVVRERGSAGARTSAIARAAGCAEGSIYRYFASKDELLREAVRSRPPELATLLRELPGRAGSGTVRENLRDAVRSTLAAYRELVPLAIGVYGAAGTQAAEDGEGALGPADAAAHLAAYLRAEQELGRVRHEADAAGAARALLDSCLGESLAGTLLGDRAAAGRELRVEALVELATRGLEPR